MSQTKKEIRTLNAEEVNLYVFGEVLYNLLSLDLPHEFSDRVNCLVNDIFNYLFPISKRYKDYEALDQYWSIITHYRKDN